MRIGNSNLGGPASHKLMLSTGVRIISRRVKALGISSDFLIEINSIENGQDIAISQFEKQPAFNHFYQLTPACFKCFCFYPHTLKLGYLGIVPIVLQYFVLRSPERRLNE